MSGPDCRIVRAARPCSAIPSPSVAATWRWCWRGGHRLKLPPYRIEDLLPHGRPMILLDELIGMGEGRLSAALTVRPGVPFFEAGRGVPAHIAIEWMAQTCGAYVGVAALEAGQPIGLGFLLGTRDFQAAVPW